jgi:hypothetical protein
MQEEKTAVGFESTSPVAGAERRRRWNVNTVDHP